MANRILVVDDEPQIQHLLRTALEGRGYEVRLAGDGRAALDAAASSWPNVIILDLGLPVIDGIEVCRRIREWSRVPIIVLSAREGDRDKVEALDLGADDYLTKPFSMEELLARLRVALRHASSTAEPPVWQCRDLTVDLSRRQVLRAGTEIHLTPTEYDLLRLFVTNVDRVLTQRQILREVWGPGYENDIATLRVFVTQLRQKIEPEPAQPRLIVTETGVGYRFRGDGCR
ncbi:MAG TPA: response regulator transcription factor [Herpetosiphonaceae bacterium]|nr:response regulator transcription factor [Herpetosiphonaceae bacterium]